jgi:hypothetical protein
METQELIIVEVFCQEYEIETNFIYDLQHFGLIETVVLKDQNYLHKNQIVILEKIIRMHHDSNINKEGIDVILSMQENEKELLSEIKYLKKRLNLYE